VRVYAAPTGLKSDEGEERDLFTPKDGADIKDLPTLAALFAVDTTYAGDPNRAPGPSHPVHSKALANLGQFSTKHRGTAGGGPS
jgi:hypothetical protein